MLYASGLGEVARGHVRIRQRQLLVSNERLVVRSKLSKKKSLFFAGQDLGNIDRAANIEAELIEYVLGKSRLDWRSGQCGLVFV